MNEQQILQEVDKRLKLSIKIYIFGEVFLIPWWLLINYFTSYHINPYIGLFIQIWFGLIPIWYSKKLLNSCKKLLNIEETK